MQTTLLLVTLLGALWVPGPTAEAQEWPCPPQTDIAPCVCSTDNEELNLELDCSDVTSTDILTNVFTQTNFPLTDFKSLTINPTGEPSPELDTLPAGVFGPVSFTEIDIMNTFINTIEDEALVNSHMTLKRLDLLNNKIVNFPFETLELFQHLREFRLAHNYIKDLPDLLSGSVFTLDLSANEGLILHPTSFTEMSYLEDIHLRNMKLGANGSSPIPANLFSQMSYLVTVDMSGNEIGGQLFENFMNPLFNSLLLLDLNYNRITDIHPEAITGLDRTAHVRLSNNDITLLTKDNWMPLLEQVSTDDAIDLQGNPLTCGCDVYWLVADRTLINKVHSQTTCFTNDYIHDLDVEWFHKYCPEGP